MNYILYLDNSVENSEPKYGLYKIEKPMADNILKNAIHSQTVQNVHPSKFGLTSNNNEMITVILMPELNFNQMYKYIETYKPSYLNIVELSSMISALTFYNVERNKKINMLENIFLQKPYFWSNTCSISMKNDFVGKNIIEFHNKTLKTRQQNSVKTIKVHNNDGGYGNNQTKKIINNDKNDFFDYGKNKFLKSILQEHIITSVVDYNSANDSNNSKDVNNKDVNNSNNTASTFSIQIDNITTNEQVNNLYKSFKGDVEMEYKFICNLLLTHELCHLAINNKFILEQISSKNIESFKMCIGYAWLSMTLEQYEMERSMNDSQRFIFDIETANKLPIYSFNYSNINNNPYACVLIHDSVLNLQKNILPYDMITNVKNKKYSKNEIYGLASLNVFKERLNIFVNDFSETMAQENISKKDIGKKNIKSNSFFDDEIVIVKDVKGYESDNQSNDNDDDNKTKTNDISETILINSNKKVNLLDVIDWNNSVLCGSLTTACSMRNYPVMLVENLTYKEYLKKYYCNSDIDLMCNYKTIGDFTNNILNIKTKLYEYNDIINDTKFHSVVFYISDDFITYFLDDIVLWLEKKNIIVDLSVSQTANHYLNNFENEILEYIYEKFYIKKNEKLKNKYIDKISNNEYLECYLSNISLENVDVRKNNVNITTHESDDSEFYENIYVNNKIALKITDTYRVKLMGLNNNFRPIEIFNIPQKSFASKVSEFHLGFVHAFYNGKTLKCLPTFISAMMIQITTKYNYFLSLTCPYSIMTKNRLRGFTVILNEDDLRNYNNTEEEVNKFYDNYDTPFKNTEHKHLGGSINSKFNNSIVVKYCKKETTEIENAINEHLGTIRKLESGIINTLFKKYTTTC